MKKKIKAPPEKYWNEFVRIFFAFCREKYGTTPTFDQSQPRDLKAIVTALRKRAEHSGVEWDYETATSRFHHFLEYAHSTDKWLRENWVLSNLNRFKDKIFLNHSKQQQQ
jgi:hypothetical protein